MIAARIERTLGRAARFGSTTLVNVAGRLLYIRHEAMTTPAEARDYVNFLSSHLRSFLRFQFSDDARASKINDIGQLRSSMSWVELPNLGISNLIALGPHHPCDHLEQSGLPFWLYLQHRTPLLADQWTQ